MKRIFVIDWIMIAAFVPAVCSGVGLHVAGHGTDHELWHARAVFHVAAGAAFFVAAVFHVVTHRGWYKGILRSGMGSKSRVTAVLSVLFAAVVLTGIALLGINGAGSAVGRWHYVTGIAASVLSVGHLLKRIPLLRRGSAGR